MKYFFTGIRRVFQLLAGLCYVAIGLLLCMVLPYLGGYQPTVILSGSMEPSIMTGDMVYVHKADGLETLKTGDVIAFQRAEDATPITHRITEIDTNTGTIKTKGDANDSEDVWKLTYDQVKGVVSGIKIPKLGFVVQYVKRPLIVGLAAFILVMNAILGSVIGDKKQECREKTENTI